MAYGNVSR